MQLVFNSLEELLSFVKTITAQKQSQTTQTQSVSQKLSQKASQQTTQTNQTTQQKASSQAQQNSQVNTKPTQPTQQATKEASQKQTEASDKATDKQLKLIFIMFKKLDIQDREIRLATASKILNKKITSFNTLTKSDATKLIKALSEKVPA